MKCRLIRLPEVIKNTGLSKSTIYKRIQDGKFPTQIQLGPRLVGWVEEEVDIWLKNQISISRDDH